MSFRDGTDCQAIIRVTPTPGGAPHRQASLSVRCGSGRNTILVVLSGRIAGAATLILAVIWLSACGIGHAAAPDGIFLPRLADETDTWPAALITGTLVEANGCIFLAPDANGINVPEVLPIWSRQTTAERTFEGTLRVVVDGRFVGQMGDHVSLGGGFVGESRNDVSQAESMMGAAIPEQCRTGGGYWITPGPA
jgi:hypothetical protein